MTKEELIKLGLTEEQATKVFENYGHMVPKGRFNEEVEEKNELKKQLGERDIQLAELSKNNANNEELKKQIAQLQADNTAKEAEYNANISKIKLDNALEQALTGSGSKNNKALKALLDMEKVKLDGDKLLGLEEQLTEIKKANDYLFNIKEEKPTLPTGITPPSGSPGTNPTTTTSLSGAIAQAMGIKN